MKLTLTLVMALAIVSLNAGHTRAACCDTVADRVFGQGGSFTANSPNNGGVSAQSLFNPSGMAYDSAGHLYVADLSNARVLEYDTPLTSQTATRVFGQPSFTSNTPNNGGVSNASLSGPCCVAVDSAGHLYVSDSANARVLEYDNPLVFQTATRVFGQPNFMANSPNNGGVSANSLQAPNGIRFDSAGRLYVADYGNYRVLEYDNPLTSQTATRVFGQPDFTTNVQNNGGVTATSLGNPSGLALDGSGRLYVADYVDNRVLEYDNPLTSQTATRVFGQPSFTSNTSNNGGLGANSLAKPDDVAVDAAGRVYVTDGGNSRALEYDNPLTSQTATRVFGQPSLTSNAPNNGGLSASSLFTNTWGIALDASSNLYIADEFNNRVLEYDQPIGPPSSVGGIAKLTDLSVSPKGGTYSLSRSQAIEFALAALGLLIFCTTGLYALRRWRR